jgi:hypothetical protein
VDYEKLGVFYLGRLAGSETPLLYDSRDLVTHAVCVGMTGSGKTGLCISLIEEAALDGIPALVIDPKGDLANLLLTFPELSPADFAPWVDPDDAARKGVSVEEHARAQAALWRDGLARWGQDGERIRRLRAAADFAVYTPGSEAGIPVSVLGSFAAPRAEADREGEAFRERVQGTATALLGLLGIEGDPVQSREHVLLANLIAHAWRDGRDVDLAGLVAAIQSPPFGRVGVLELEAFYPAKDRFGLALRTNNLLASPGFETWLRGDPLDVHSLLYGPDGRPRVAIFSIAHLGDAERMFFVSLLLEQVLAWMSGQPGTTSLRALVYMDEIFGFFPPVANPPSKQPLLTLMKQARAFGVGVVLATQNPVDLDYKGLANAGTWFVGRLQTERDKARLLDGLEGAAAAAGDRLDRAELDRLLSGLESRRFLLHNVHEEAPVVFESRWAMSYLRGPLTRAQIKTLMDPGKAGAQRGAEPAPARPAVTGPAARRVLGIATLRFAEGRRGKSHEREVALLAPIDGRLNRPSWDEADDASGSPADGEPAPANLLRTWQRDFTDWLGAGQTLELFTSERFRVTSRPGESEGEFRARVAQLAREERDAAVAKLRQKYAAKLAALEERIHRARAAVAREREQASHAKLSTAIDVGAGILGALLGGRRTGLGRLATSARSAGRAYGQTQDVGRAEDSLERLEEQLRALQSDLDAEAAALASPADPPCERITLRPRKTAIRVRFLGFPRA